MRPPPAVPTDTLTGRRGAMRRWRGLIAGLALCLILPMLGWPARAAPPEPGQTLQWLRAPSPLSLSQVLALSPEMWETIPAESSLGYRTGSHWFRRAIAFENTSPEGWRLSIENPVLDHISLWVRLYGANGQRADWMHWQLGDKLPFAARPLDTRHFVVPIPSQTSEWPAMGVEVLARVETTSSLQVPIRLMTTNQFIHREVNLQLFYGAYVGVMVGLLVYNLMLWLMNRERLYGLYIIWVLHFAIFVLDLEGLLFQHLWPNATTWNDRSLIYFLGAAVTFGNAFLLGYLADWPGLPRLFRHTGKETLVLAGVVLLSTTVLPYAAGILTMIALSVFLVLRAHFLVAWATWRGHRPARLLLFAFSTVFLGGMVLALQRLGLLEHSNWTQNATLIGSAVEVILMSTVLGDRLASARHLGAQAAEQAQLNLELSEANGALQTARQLAEERAQAVLVLQDQVKREAEQRDRERLRFLAGAVHDLKQPIQAISVSLDPLQQAIQSGNRSGALGLFGLLQQATEGMRLQLASLLDLSRLESGSLRPHLAPVALAPLVESLQPTLQEIASRQGVEIRWNVPPEAWGHTDAEMMRRVALNLATNGIKYADPEKRGHRWMMIDVYADRRHWVLRVADNGIGIAPEHIESGDIYRPFFQVHQHLPEEIRGVGLGLSIVKSTLRLLPDHELSLTSAPLVGTRFEIRLPACDPVSEHEKAVEARAPIQFARLRRNYVLVVEDDSLVRQSLSSLFAGQGIRYDSFATLQDLHAQLEGLERTPDVVLCDYLLPNGKTAHDVLHLLRETFGHLPCLLLSAEKLRAEDFHHGAAIEICSKPAAPNDILAALDRLCTSDHPSIRD